MNEVSLLHKGQAYFYFGYQRKETMKQDIILTPAIQMPVIVLHADVVQKADELTLLAANMKIDDVFTLAVADDTKKDCANLLKAIEVERVRVKAPFLDVGKQIDAAAAGIVDKLTLAARALATNIIAFTREQERIRQEAETKARIERDRLEAIQRAETMRIEEENRKRSEEAKSKGVPAPAPVMAPIAKLVMSAPVMPPPIKSTSTTTMKQKVLVIDDATLIPWSIGGVTLLIPDEKAIKKLILAGVTVPGCRIEEKEVPRGL